MDIALVSEKIEAKANEIDENDFSKSYLVPLFKALGYEEVDFYGGVDEKGKDIIAWRSDEFDSLSLTVVQVKYYKPTARAGDKKAFGNVVTQLQQANEKEVPFTDGKKYLPSRVILITPFVIDTRTLETRFEAIEGLRHSRIKVIDGAELARLLIKYLPSVVNDIIGKQLACNEVISKTLCNIDLKNALNSPNLKEISDIYCDLDFAVGKTTSRFFFSINIQPKKLEVTVNQTEWLRLQEVAKSCQLAFQANIIEGDPNRLRKKFDEIITWNDKIRERIEKTKDTIASLGIEDFIDAIIDRGLCENSDDIQDIIIEMAKRRSKYKTTEIKKIDSYSKYLAETKEDMSQLLANQIKIDNTGLITLLHNYSTVLKDYESLELKLIEEVNKIKPDTIDVSINGKHLAQKLLEKRDYLSAKFLELEQEGGNVSTVSSLVEECFTILKEADTVLNYSLAADVVGINRSQEFRPTSTMERISVPIHKLFHTRKNFILYGEAGAGKSTTLQTYAKKMIDEIAECHIYYVPLSKAFHNVSIQAVDDFNHGQKLLDTISRYLIILGLPSEPKFLENQLSSGTCLLILDGIDEVIEKVPWIIKGITSISTRLPKVQLLLSSRLTGKYIDDIPFFGLTLLPFTDYQRHKFFKQWLVDDLKVKKLEEHLSFYPDLNDIVRNPLLATLLCSLAEHDAPLPDTEIKIYEERMHLLLGRYDLHKKSVRVISHSTDLWKVARKTAYILHASEMRHAKKEFLMTELKERLNGKIKEHIIDKAFSELIDPCNILVPMTEDGQYGFGHLRFQEYLAACELQANRGISPLHFLRKPSWKGALILFSMMTDDIEDIIAEIIEKDNLTRHLDILNSMLEVRPEKEKEGLMEIIDKHLALDRIGLHRY